MTRPLQMKPMYSVLLRGSDQMNTGRFHLFQLSTDQLTRLHYGSPDMSRPSSAV